MVYKNGFDALPYLMLSINYVDGQFQDVGKSRITEKWAS